MKVQWKFIFTLILLGIMLFIMDKSLKPIMEAVSENEARVSAMPVSYTHLYCTRACAVVFLVVDSAPEEGRAKLNGDGYRFYPVKRAVR